MMGPRICSGTTLAGCVTTMEEVVAMGSLMFYSGFPVAWNEALDLAAAGLRRFLW